ncbi:MAG: CoA transferase [Dehalococcoidia bacterium]|nr:CoA transferase [Dehalococcoidia bacterium]MDW8120094.1 CoA transferase [Chloroflexota bacterium]
MSLPLEGIRIVDMTIVIAGPVATQVLAALGAQVIKVEPPWGRTVGRVHSLPGVASTGKPYNAIPSFNEVNRGKWSISLNLQHPLGREAFLRLVSVSDVVIENFSPRVLPNLGLDYPVLRQYRPDIILISMPALGHTGPWRNYISFGPGTDALAGLSSLTGYEGGQPHKPGNYYADQNSAVHTAFAVLTALYRRRRTGKGAHLRIALREATQAVIGEFFLEPQMTGRIPTRMGNRHPWMAPHGIYPCKGQDAWVAIACATDQQFRSLCALIGRPDLAQDPRCADSLSRKRHEALLDAPISAWTRQHSPQEAMDILQQAGVPAGAVFTIPQILENDHWRSLGFVREVHHPEMGRALHPGLPWRATGLIPRDGEPAPLFAQHTSAVLGDLLGFSAETIAQMVAQKVAPAEPVGG